MADIMAEDMARNEAWIMRCEGLKARIRELEVEIAALKKTIEINSVGQEILEAKDKKIAELRIRIRW